MQGKSILFVDDEPIILGTFHRELRSDELQITLAPGGEEALHRINDTAFDLVVTDMMMPVIDGFQVLRAAKQKDALTKVILLTGYGDMEAVLDALRGGADDFLLKPCDTDELRYRIGNCFEKQDLQRKVAMYEKYLPVCCYCRKVRDDSQVERGKGAWYSLEEYLSRVKGVHVSHGCCPECYTKKATKWM